VAINANKINGGNNNLIIDTNGGWYTLLYTGSTYGWKVG
jgi:hemin uptake protein HemP